MGNKWAITKTKTGLIGMSSYNGIGMIIWDGIPDEQCAVDAGKWLKRNREDHSHSVFISIMAPTVQLPSKQQQDIIQSHINPNIRASDATAIVLLGTGVKAAAVRAFLATTLFILNRTSIVKGATPRAFSNMDDAIAWIQKALEKKGVQIDPIVVNKHFESLLKEMSTTKYSK